MAPATPTAQDSQTDARPDGERRCIVTGQMRAKDGLIRFVIAPDRTVVPDLAHNLPGRGLWVTAEREAIETAARKNIFAKAAKSAAKADPDLAGTVVQLLKKRCLEWLGLARSAGIGVLGQPQVEAALKAGTLALLLIADDAAANGLGKIKPASIRVMQGFTRNELGLALGHEQIVYAGLKSHGLTEKLQFMLTQLEKLGGTRHLSHENG